MELPVNTLIVRAAVHCCCHHRLHCQQIAPFASIYCLNWSGLQNCWKHLAAHCLPICLSIRPYLPCLSTFLHSLKLVHTLTASTRSLSDTDTDTNPRSVSSVHLSCFAVCRCRITLCRYYLSYYLFLLRQTLIKWANKVPPIISPGTLASGVCSRNVAI